MGRIFSSTTAEPQALDEIREWRSDMIEAILHQRASVQRAIRDGLPIATRFAGMTWHDVEIHSSNLVRELDRLTVLNLVASAEAALRSDFLRRVGKRLKDPLARAYRAWHRTLSRKKQQVPDLDDRGILDMLKKAKVIDNTLVGQYRECLRARNWMAHGRYWDKPVEVDLLDPDEVYIRCDSLLRALP